MSTNLGATQLSGGMANPETAVNTATGRLDAAMTEILVVDLTNDVTLTTAQYQSAFRIDVTPSGTGKKLTLAAVKRMCLVKNASANSITVKKGSTEIALTSGSMGLFYTDGTTNDLTQVDLIAVGSQPHDLHAFFPGAPADGAVILRFDATRAFTLPASLTGSIFKALNAATASSVFTVKKNGSSVGTVTFASSSATGTVSFASTVSLAAGDVLTIEAPSPQDATLADLSFNFLGNR